MWFARTAALAQPPLGRVAPVVVWTASAVQPRHRRGPALRSWPENRLFVSENCSRHDRSGSRMAQHRPRWSSCAAQPSAVRLRWTPRCVRGAGSSSGCFIDVARASTGAVSDTDKPPPNAPTVRTDQHAHGRDSTRCGAWTFTVTPEHQSVGASGSAYEKLAAARGLRAQVSVVWRSGCE